MITRSEAETEALGASIAKSVQAGDIILLHGTLGAGKTVFVRGFLGALGYLGAVRSPTFNLIQTFETSPPVVHADLYRLDSAEGLGLEDYLMDSVALIEWPERAAGFFGSEFTEVRFEVLNESERKISVVRFDG
jgi:tRNA threonylcarbamoyladenosine biosynthesis protein TsaE